MLPFARPQLSDAEHKVLHRWLFASLALHAVLAVVLVVSAVVTSQAKQSLPADPQMTPFKETGAPASTVASAPVKYRVA